MPKPPEIKINKVNNPQLLETVFAIRREVFVVEQNCPPELEWEHEEESIHFLATVDGQPAGACRWRKTDLGYKLERFAVLKQYRGLGVAHTMVTTLLNDLPADANYIYLNAQIAAMPLYAKSGFEKTGPQFEEAGIQHYKMVKKA